MSEIKITLDNRGRGRIAVEDNGQVLGEMVVGLSGSALTVYHTEVVPEMEGMGLAKQMFEKMLAFVREKNLMVIPLCPYVYAQFRKHPEDYADIWKR